MGWNNIPRSGPSSSSAVWERVVGYDGLAKAAPELEQVGLTTYPSFVCEPRVSRREWGHCLTLHLVIRTLRHHGSPTPSGISWGVLSPHGPR